MDQVSNQITKLIEHLQLPGQFQRREAAITISAAAATVAVAGAMYSLLQKALDDPGCKTIPYTSPLSGSTKEYRKDPKAFIEKWTKELGPVFRAHVFGEVMTVVSGPYIREIFLNNDFNFKHGINKRFNLQLLLGLDHDADTVIPLLRQIVLKHLHNNMKPYTPRVVQQLKKAGDEIMGDVSQEKIFPHVYPIMQHMIANAAASIFVGEKLVKDEKLIESFKNMTLDCGAELQSESVFFEHFSTLNSWRQWIIGKFSKTIQRHKSQLYNALKPEVEERLANINKPGWERPKDILQDLLEDALKNPPRKELVQHLAEWIIQLIFASVHTTSENSTVVMYRILQHPELIPELLEEQNQVLCEYLGEDVVKSTDDAVSLFTFDVVRNLPKLDSVCRESLRLRNDYLTLTHKYMGKSKFTLSNGAVIKPGEYVQINTWFNHTDDKIQHDDFGNRTEFQPFRYVNLQDRQSTKVGDDYLVFGLGKHACPGRWFALQEIKTIVSFFIRQYEISNKSGIIFPTDDVNKLPVGDFVVKKRFS